MAGRSGLFGGFRQGGVPEWPADSAGQDPLAGGFRVGEAVEAPTPPGFDPVWGTLGAPAPQPDPWATDEAPFEGKVSDVEIFGLGFRITGQINTRGFDRISDWLNMQSGFIQLQEASHVLLGQHELPERERNKGTLWVKLDQIVLLAERTAVQQSRGSSPVIQKQRRKVSIVTMGYNLRGSLHLHAAALMKQFLETPDPHFVPITDLTVHWLDNPRLAAHFPFAMINREQLITVLEEPVAPEGSADADGGPTADELTLRHQGAA